MADTVVNVWRGSNVPLRFVFRDGDGFLIGLAGSRFVMRLITDGQIVLMLDTDVDVATFYVVFSQTYTPQGGTLITADMLVWARTVEQSRLIQLGALTTWELERWIDDRQEPAGRARFNGLGGDNPDA